MALIDVIKWEVNDREFCYKFPSEDLRLGSQLVVYPSQTAIFVKGGQICDVFKSGTYTLKPENIPLLNKLINLPFGSNSPFKAEIWFINQITKFDIKWGTPTPIQLEDPKYNIVVPIRAFGQYGIKITEPQRFLEMLIGNMSSFSIEKIEQYFKGKVLSQLSSLISRKITQDNISILEINTHLPDMSEYCNERLNSVFYKYGIEIREFSFISINIPSNDPSIIKLKEAKDIAARMRIAGKDIYQMERSFDVMEAAASNEGAGGGVMAMGTGLGAGLGVGSQMGNMFSNTMSTRGDITPPPLPQEEIYFIAINNKQQGGYDVHSILSMINQGQITPDTLIWKKSLENWVKASSLPEFTNLFNSTPPSISTNL